MWQLSLNKTVENFFEVAAIGCHWPSGCEVCAVALCQWPQVHGHLQAQRLITQPVARSNHCNLRVLGNPTDDHFFGDLGRKPGENR